MLKGKTAPIAGSLGGIGFAIAKALAGLGYDVMLNGFAPADTIDARVADIFLCGSHSGDIDGAWMAGR